MMGLSGVVQIKGTVSGYKGRVLLFSETFEINRMLHQARTSAGSIADRIASTTPTAVVRSSLTHLMTAGKHRNED